MENNTDIAHRVSSLYEYGFLYSDLADWFHISKHPNRFSRYATNTKQALEIWEVLKSLYQYRCAYCGRKTKQLEKDHVVPVSKEGEDDMANIVPACKPCNRSKSARHLLDWENFEKLQLRLFGS